MLLQVMGHMFLVMFSISVLVCCFICHLIIKAGYYVIKIKLNFYKMSRPHDKNIQLT